jgi:hypothetical protein
MRENPAGTITFIVGMGINGKDALLIGRRKGIHGNYSLY